MAALSAAAYLAGSAAFADAGKESATFAYKPVLRWTIRLPKETFSPVATQIPIAREGGTGFAATLEGGELVIDTDGDGKPDSKAKGQAGFAKLHGKTTAGREFDYAVRLVSAGGWKYAASGFMTGKLKGVDIRLIDQNNNGRYDDFGVDAMIVGDGDSAAFLSRVVNLGGSLFELGVSADGFEVAATPYSGPAGTLDIRKNFDTQGKLSSFVVQSAKGDASFDLAAAAPGGVLVPAGEYTLKTGVIGTGNEKAQITPGRMAPFTVKAGETTAPAWGGPLHSEFTYSNTDGELVILPDLRFFGRSGEEYVRWVPDGASPTFHILDKKTKEELAVGWFGSG
jgi:hypothetical protein